MSATACPCGCAGTNECAIYRRQQSTAPRCACDQAMIGRTITTKQRRGFSVVKAPVTFWTCPHCDQHCPYGAPAGIPCGPCAHYALEQDKRARKEDAK